MLNKVIKTTVMAAAIAGMVAGTNATVKAETVEVNIYGASAQYKFWRDAAPEFLKAQGCSESDIYAAKGDVDDRDNGIAVCAGSDVSGMNGVNPGSGINGDGKTYIIRYTTNASYDGIRAVQGLNPDGVDSDCNDPNLRKMGDETNSEFKNYFTEGYGTVYSTKCCDITIGASDVAAETFRQQSHGALKGPFGGDWQDRNISGLTMDPDYIAYRPVVVPFAFFVNADEEHPVPFDNITRLMATSLFSGQVKNWNQFKPDLDGDGTPNEPGLYTVDPNTGEPTQDSGDSLPVILCFRHAGSGTHATLDAAVMRNDYPLLAHEALPGSMPVVIGIQPVTYFNKGSSDEMRCVGGNNAIDQFGAIGYADADKEEGQPIHNGHHGDIRRVKFQGEEPVKGNILNGKYDFWSAQWLYRSNEEPQEVADLCDALAEFASDPENLPADHAEYWAAQSEMQVEKNTDFSYPKFKQ